MNKIYKVFALAGMITMLGACNSDPEYYVLKEQPDEMHVAAQLGVNGDSEKNLITLSGNFINDDAVRLTWTAIPSNDPVKYLVRFYATESKNDNYTQYYCNPETCPNQKECQYNHDGVFGMDEKGNYTFSLTHNQLNSIIARWAYPGDEINVTAMVVGTINNELTYIKPQTSTIDFNAVGWEKYPISLIAYVTDAKGKKSTLELTQKDLGTGVYTGELTAAAGTVYFQKPVTSKQAASYYMDPETGLLKYIEEELPNAPVREEEMQFTITGAGTLMVDVNDEYNDVQILKIQMPAGANPYMVGDGIDVGWVLQQAPYYMVQSSNPRTPYIYTWTGQFYAPGDYPAPDQNGVGGNGKGEFKVLTADAWGGMGFYASEAGANPAENHVLMPARAESDGGDNKWIVPVTGKYTFTIDALNMTTSFERN